MTTAILAIDQGTTNSKAVLLSASGAVLARGAAPVGIAHPRPGWVEQDATEIWESQLAGDPDLSRGIGRGADRAIGISNQREVSSRLGPAGRAAPSAR